MNTSKFQSLYPDADPLVGHHDPGGKGELRHFIGHLQLVRRRIKDQPRLVMVRGEAYFMLPGRRTIRFLATRS